MRYTRPVRRFAAIWVAAVLLAAVLVAPPLPNADAQGLTAAEVNERLGVGVNLGNALEGPREGDWGLTLREEYFTTIAGAGFGHVRVPIRFSGYTSDSPPYTIPDGIDPTVPNADNLWDRIDWVIENAERNGLYVILDLHLFDEFSEDVAGERDHFLAIWEQVSERYADASSWVLFELLNEADGQFNEDASLLNAALADALGIIRQTNPTRPVLVGPAYWNQIGALAALELPDDPNLIVSVHFYDPFDFTHQGATWLDSIPPAPAGFDGDLVDFGAGWGDWSWRSAAVPSPTSLNVTFDGRWAGLAFGRPSLGTPESLKVVVSGASELLVRCALANDVNTDVIEIATTAAVQTFDIDMTSCPDATTSINFMAVSETVETLSFFEIELCEADGQCRMLIESAEDAITTAFDEAAAWGQANGRPMNVGEFGAYSANGVADLGDRATWTEMVRSAGTSRGFSMTYWEFGAGFGVYDRTTDMWVPPLLEALGVQPRSGSGYVALDPSRLLDTRAVTQHGEYSTPWGPGETRILTVAGPGATVPNGATAVAVHLTTVPPANGAMAPVSWLNAFPSGESPETAAVHVFGSGPTVAGLTNDLAFVALGPDGSMMISNAHGDVDLVIDVVGYFAPGSDRYVSLDGAARVIDSRPAFQIGPFSTPWASTTRSVVVAGGNSSVPANATAVAMHITTTDPVIGSMAPASWLTVEPTGSVAATSAVHNFGTSSSTRRLSNDLVIAKVGESGQIDITNAHGSVDLVIDIVGYFAVDPGGTLYSPRSPIRVLDTRAQASALQPGETRVISDPIMNGCNAVAMHVTSVAPADGSMANSSWLTPASVSTAASVHNFGYGPGQRPLSNDLVIGTISGSGQTEGVVITNAHGSVDLVVDVVGLFDDDFADSGLCLP